jgi:two-component system CheB/CheR fusion protein
MQNLLAATDIASIYLDTRLRIQRYTPAAGRIINLIPTDIGRPLSDLKTLFPAVDLAGMAQRVLDDLNSREMEIESQDRVWYLLRLIPYRTIDNVIDGAVITLTNIQKLKQADKLRRLATVLADANDAVTVQDFDGRILAWNRGAETMYGWSESEALKMDALELVPEDALADTRSLIERIKKGQSVRTLKTRRKTKSGKILEIWLTATSLTDSDGRPVEMATTERDLAWLLET